MTKAFKVGDRVSWNSEAGRVSGTIIRVHMRDVEHKGYTHHANPDVPQYEVKSAPRLTISPSTKARRSQSFATDAAVVARRDR
jgi:hypothetical protein